jgi:hypothetical protein
MEMIRFLFPVEKRSVSRPSSWSVFFQDVWCHAKAPIRGIWLGIWNRHDVERRAKRMEGRFFDSSLYLHKRFGSTKEVKK